jgi:predicted DNA-binding protein YlxM (UPF0122 family)
VSPRVASAEKRLRISLLLDAYGELLTEKQRDFLRRYYEEDYSFGEIARDYNVSRQAIFDSVKHGEAALENYERVLGLVEARDGLNGAAGPLGEAAGQAERVADALRRWASGDAIPEPGELEALAAGLERLAAGLRSESPGPIVVGTPAGNAGDSARGGRGAGLRVGDGPEID